MNAINNIGIPEWFTRTCPIDVVGITLGRAHELFTKALEPISESYASGSDVKTVTLCISKGGANCFKIETSALLEQVVEQSESWWYGSSAKVVKNLAQLTTKVTPIEKNFLYKFLFGSEKGFTHLTWLEGQNICESIIGGGSDKIATGCYQSPFDARLLSQVCTFTQMDAEGSLSSYLFTSMKVAQSVMGLGCAFKAFENFRQEGTLSKVRAIGWSALSAAVFIGPSLL